MLTEELGIRGNCLECDEGRQSCNLGMVMYRDISTPKNPELPMVINNMVLQETMNGFLKREELDDDTEVREYKKRYDEYVAEKTEQMRQQLEHSMSSESVNVQFSEATETRESSCKVGVSVDGESEPVNIKVGGKRRDSQKRPRAAKRKVIQDKSEEDNEDDNEEDSSSSYNGSDGSESE